MIERQYFAYIETSIQISYFMIYFIYLQDNFSVKNILNQYVVNI